MVDHVVIMAGGAGKRLWPASHNEKPKQFMTIKGEDSLFCSTIKRAYSLDLKGYIVVVTHKDHIPAALEDAKSLELAVRKKLVFIAESEARNTAPALAYAAAWLGDTDLGREATVLVLAADHLIEDIDTFKADAENASVLASHDKLVVFGIHPEFPSTGYGYIEAGDKFSVGFDVESFKEKPDSETAKSFIAAGNYYWNSGMFTYKLSVFEKELLAATPSMITPFLKTYESPNSYIEAEVEVVMPSHAIETLYGSLPKESIDYALMEKSCSIAMAEAHFDWNDVGSWDVIADINPPATEAVFETEGEGNFAYSDLPVAFCGVSDLVVVVKNGKVLVCKKGASQLVKEAAETLK